MKGAATIISILLVSLYFTTGLCNQNEMAVIINAHGNVELIRSDGTQITEFKKFSTPLYEGDSLSIGKDSYVKICFISGETKTYFGEDHFRIPSAVESGRQNTFFKRMIKKLTNRSSVVKEHVGGTRSATSTFSLVGPRKGFVPYKAIRFEWTAMKDVKSYDFVLGEGEDILIPIFSKTVRDSFILIFPDSLNLQRGKKYFWKVKPQTGNTEVWDSSFFKIYSFKNESIFYSGKNQILQLFQQDYEIPMIVYLDYQEAYYDELCYLRQLLFRNPDNKMYLELMVGLLAQIGLPDLAHKYALRVEALKNE